MIDDQNTRIIVVCIALILLLKEMFDKSAANNLKSFNNFIGDDFPNAESLLEALFQLETAANDPCNNLVLPASRLPGNNLSTDAAFVASAMSGEHVQSSTNPGMKF